MCMFYSVQYYSHYVSAECMGNSLSGQFDIYIRLDRCLSFEMDTDKDSALDEPPIAKHQLQIK